jgi:hypothetical protein
MTMVRNCTTKHEPTENFICCHTRHLGRSKISKNLELHSILYAESQKEGSGPTEGREGITS